MKSVNQREPWFLFLGDILILIFSLWLTLLLRLGTNPGWAVFIDHLFPFSILFTLWFIVFFISGLYEKHTTLFKQHLPGKILRTQIFNSLLAVVFFYFIPYFGITPKTILFIYLIISLILIFFWRLYGQNLFGLGLKERAMILGRGEDFKLLLQEVNNNPRYGLEFVSAIDLDLVTDIDFKKDIVDRVNDQDLTVIVIDWQSDSLKKNLPRLYELLFLRVRFLDINALYENIFDRVPLSFLNYDWFLENISLSVGLAYDVFKRLLDIFFSLLFGIASLIFYPFIILAIKIYDGGPAFIVQDRIGKNNLPIKVIKFRSMSFNDNEEAGSKTNKITTVGKFLRQSRLDELPQLWNVLSGDLSLIGPRPELPALVDVYEQKVPYYKTRHLIKPGLSGWAQLYHTKHPHQGANTEETKNKLSYDLYYIKNRSLLLDLKITLKTIKTLLSQTGK